MWVSTEYSATYRRTLQAGDMFVSRKMHGIVREIRWHRG